MDKDDKVLGNTVGYRDHRNEGMDEEVYKTISLEDLYARTGIQKAIFNTVYQLMAVKTKHPEISGTGWLMLHVPDYFHYLLTGKKTCEYTEANNRSAGKCRNKGLGLRTQLINLDIQENVQKLIMPGTSVGHFTEEVKAEGLMWKLLNSATHDTGSPVLAVPANDDDFIYIIGTWSLMGIIEREKADCKKSCEMNFTNEGGYAGRFRYLKISWDFG